MNLLFRLLRLLATFWMRAELESHFRVSAQRGLFRVLERVPEAP